MNGSNLYLEQIRLKASEKRPTVMESIKTAGAVLGTGFNTFLSDWDKIAAAGAGLSAYRYLPLVFILPRAAPVWLLDTLNPESASLLVRETSRLNLVDTIRHPIKTIQAIKAKSEDALSEVVLEPKLEERLRDIAIATKNTKQNK